MSELSIERKKISKMFNDGFFQNDFENMALQVFNFQYRHNPVYTKFCNIIGKSHKNVGSIKDIPFLPIQFFKTYAIKTGDWQAKTIFKSSGTTSEHRSKHHISDLQFYKENSLRIFENVYGPSEKFSFLAVLPGYIERPDSSLIYMVNEMISKSIYDNSGFYISNRKALFTELKRNRDQKIPTILFGVSFALLDLLEWDLEFPELIIIETGGMKNLDKELSKKEIFEQITTRWKIGSLDSEYGMTELLSQAYARNELWFRAADSMQISIGQLNDPFNEEKMNKTGIIRVIDLANFDSCSFIETQDLGLKNVNGAFQVIGRMDNAELRGCNLLLSDMN